MKNNFLDSSWNFTSQFAIFNDKIFDNYSFHLAHISYPIIVKNFYSLFRQPLVCQDCVVYFESMKKKEFDLLRLFMNVKLFASLEGIDCWSVFEKGLRIETNNLGAFLEKGVRN